jgi:hypothetical protein
MNWVAFHIVQQEAAERALVRERARRARERRIPTSRKGTRRLSRPEAISMIAKRNPRAALKLLQGYGVGVRHPVPERRDG